MCIHMQVNVGGRLKFTRINFLNIFRQRKQHNPEKKAYPLSTNVAGESVINYALS